jgi:radical SAM protein with 4Fe4S-binding SPASM domain
MYDIFARIKRPKRFHLIFVLTYKCNLNCAYCFENNRKDISTDVDEEFIKKTINEYLDDPLIGECEITFFGGEPLLCADVIRNVCEWTWSKKWQNGYVFFANTNGTMLTEEMKEWFKQNHSKIWLGLSLDGTEFTQNRNRSNSFRKIDMFFFLKTWPEQSIKMTIDPRQPLSFSSDIIFLHSQGFSINGTDFAEGFPIDWESMKKNVVREMDKLLDYYLATDIAPAPIMDMWIDDCAASNKTEPKKWCGAGTKMIAYDIDGKSYPCTYFSPLTFSREKLKEIEFIDFSNIKLTTDEECNDCYIQPLCLTCYGANYAINGSPNMRDKSKCAFTKMRALYSSKLLVERFFKREIYYIEKYPIQSLMLMDASMKINKLYGDILTFY